MEDKIDQKIKDILKDLRIAHLKSEKFYATEVDPNVQKVPKDIYEMSLAFDDKKRIYIDLQLARSEKFPDRYSAKQIKLLEKERERLTRQIRAWQHRQFPSQYRD